MRLGAVDRLMQLGPMRLGAVDRLMQLGAMRLVSAAEDLFSSAEEAAP
jgi:hypothetical protein